MSSPLISIIIPVYNTERYLNCCIDSILSQTFTDFELLLIDDGSTDKSGDICDDYAQKDSRIRAFHKKNGGVSSARNMGLENAKGVWIAFVDSDDYLKNSYLNVLMSHTNEDIDLIISFPEVILKDYSIKLDRYTDGIVSQFNFEQLFVQYDMHEHTSPWGKLYRAEVIKNFSLKFCEQLCFGEDTVFLYTFMLNMNRAYICNVTDYCYRGAIDGSLSKRINPPGTELLNYKAVYNIVKILIYEKKIVSEGALSKLNLLIEIYTWRLTNSLYHYYLTRKERMEIIKSLDYSVFAISLKDNLNVFLLKYLLQHKYFYLYDILRYLKRRLFKTSK